MGNTGDADKSAERMSVEMAMEWNGGDELRMTSWFVLTETSGARARWF